MTSNSAESGTSPIREVSGLNSGQAVRSRVNGLIVHRLSKDTPSARALRAQLRSALGKETGSIPAIWDLTLDDESQYLGNTPTRGEKAVHGALTLWAQHQGSNKRQMHDVSDHPRRFASAIRVVAEKQRGDKRAEETPIYRSFSAAIQAPTYEGLLVRLRSLVSQLEAAEVPCDYGYLASDLFHWQDPSRRTSVVRNWGRQFARTTQTASASAQ
jgi:CRISPR system CASCADE complex protein casB